MENKILELSNRELKEIYSGLVAASLGELGYISQIEERTKENDKELLELLKIRAEKRMCLINKINKFIDWQKE